METKLGTSYDSFNRYMVECEFCICIYVMQDECSFNRYMVECEFLTSGRPVAMLVKF